MDVRSGKTIDVIELQPARLRAPLPVLRQELAASLRALVYGPLDGIGNVARRPGRRRRSSVGSRLSAHRKSLLLQIDDQGIERLLEHRRQLAVGNTVSEEILCLAKLVAKRARRRELDLEG